MFTKDHKFIGKIIVWVDSFDVLVKLFQIHVYYRLT